MIINSWEDIKTIERFERNLMDQYQQEKQMATYGLGGNPIRPVPYRMQIQQTIKHLEEQLSRQKEMLKLLDENPAIEKFMDLSRG